MSILSKRLRNARMEKVYTQQALSDEIDIALRTYQCYEQGRIAPSLPVLIKIADVLGISLDYLVGRDDFINFNRNNTN